MKRIRHGIRALLFAVVMLASLVVPVGTANAASDYDDLLKVSPTLYVYTDGGSKTQKMDISATWWSEFKQTYAKRVAQNIGWPTNFVTEFEDIVASGGSWGVYMQDATEGTTITIVGTHDPDAHCAFVGSVSEGSYQCRTNPGYDLVRASYFTHNSFGSNGCYGSYGNRCSDTGMNVYSAPTVQSAATGQYLIFDVLNGQLSDYRLFIMNFALSYPLGYEGQMIPTGAPVAKYIAMGDSFSSGEGNPPFEAGTGEDGVNECHRSPRAYPRLLQNNPSPMSTAFVACSGATTNDVLGIIESDPTGRWNDPAQIDALSEDAEVVTITIGGNDVGFKSFATACTIGSCDFATTAYSDIHGKIVNDLPGELEDVYEAIDGATSSTADIYVVGYPHIAPAEMPTGPNSACYPLNGGTDNPDPELNDGATAYAVINELNSVIEDAVADMNSAKFHFVDPNLSDSPFIGHDWCQQDRYFVQIGIPIPPSNTEYSFHPNVDGQEAYKTIVESQIN